MSLLYWVLFGLVAGGIANYLDTNAQGGVLGSIVLGIIGAVVGGYLGEQLFGVSVTGFNLRSFVFAVIGSLLVLAIGRMLISN